MLIFKKSGLISFSFVQEENSNFYSQLEWNNKNMYYFGRKEIIDLFVCLFCSKMQANKCFFNPFAQLFFDVPRQWQEKVSLML